MNVTDVRINKITSKKSSLLAFANITLDDEIVLTGIKILDGSKGVFVAMPSREGGDGEYYDLFFPITKEARAAITEAVLDAYEDEDEKPKKGKKR